MKFLVLAAFLGCVAAEADPALFYGSGLTYGAGYYGGVYGGVHNGVLGYAGYPAYGYSVAAPVARTGCVGCVAAPVTTTYTTSYGLPSVYSGYHHGLGYAGIYGGYGLPLIKAAEVDASAEEARKKREAEADPALFYSHSYGVHGAGYVPSVYSHAGYGLGYAGYHGLGYTGHHGLGYAGYHGLPRTYVSGYARYPYAYGHHGYVIKAEERAADAENAMEEA